MGEEKKIERINDKMVKITIDIEKLMSNQEVYNLFAQLKQEEIQAKQQIISYNQQARTAELNLEKIKKEIQFIDDVARDCEKRIPKNEEN